MRKAYFVHTKVQRNTMNRILVVAAIAASLVGTATADAASRKKERSYHQPHARMMWNAPVSMRRVGPPWAMPNECFTDEGYGRYQSCDAGRR
jgi:hypothetical protein